MHTGERKDIHGLPCFLGLCGFLVIFISVEGRANAQWPSGPSANLPICDAAGSQYGPRLIKATDGYIVFWQDERRVSRDIYAQKFDINGNMKWAGNGRVIAAGNNGEASNNLLFNSQSLTDIVSDTQGGAIALWTEDYPCSSGPCGNAWITRVASNGDVQWGAAPTPGVAIQGADTAVLLNGHAHSDAIAPDGEGGAFVIFGVNAWGSWYVYRLDANGSQRSATADVVGARSGARMIYGGNTNGKDYVNIAWWDYGDYAISIEDPEVNYPASTDTLSAPWNGISLTTTPAWWSEPSPVSDGAGGMIVAWADDRNGNNDIYAQRVGAGGSVQWTPGGVPIAVQPGRQRFQQIVSDGDGGAVVVWEDSRSSSTRIYAQHVGADGSTLWAADGIPISSGYGESPKIIRSDNGTYIVAWVDTDHNGGTKDYLRAQKINTAGSLLWPEDGRTPSGGTTGVVIGEIYGADFDIASDGGRGFIAVWELGGDIYARRMAPTTILWQEVTAGWLYVWHMDDVARIGGEYLTPDKINPTWRMVGIADFDDDGRKDILWQEAAGGWLYVWYMDGMTRIGGEYLTPNKINPTWRMVGVADFNDDGQEDILWQEAAGGWLYVWYMDGVSKIGSEYLTPNRIDPTWRMVGIADFSGDGQGDILWQETTAGWLYVWYMDGVTKIGGEYLTPNKINPTWRMVGVSDFNGDGQGDILWQETMAGWLYVWYMDGATRTGGEYLSPDKINPTWRMVGIDLLQ